MYCSMRADECPAAPPPAGAAPLPRAKTPKPGDAYLQCIEWEAQKQAVPVDPDASYTQGIRWPGTKPALAGTGSGEFALSC